MEFRVRDIIIAGGGPTGLTAATYAARANLKPLVIEGVFVVGDVHDHAHRQTVTAQDLVR